MQLMKNADKKHSALQSCCGNFGCLAAICAKNSNNWSNLQSALEKYILDKKKYQF